MMIRSIKALALACTAVFAVGAAAAAPASALLFLVENATTELVLFDSSKVATLETVGGQRVNCASTSADGTLLSKTDLADKIVVVFHKCEEETFLGSACTSTNPASGSSGLIQTVPLMGLLVMVKGAKSAFGIRLEPESGATITEFACDNGIEKAAVTGGVLGEILEPEVNERSRTIVFAKGAGDGEQAIKRYETLEGSGAAHLNVALTGLISENAEASEEVSVFAETSNPVKMCGP